MRTVGVIFIGPPPLTSRVTSSEHPALRLGTLGLLEALERVPQYCPSGVRFFASAIRVRFLAFTVWLCHPLHDQFLFPPCKSQSDLQWALPRKGANSRIEQFGLITATPYCAGGPPGRARQLVESFFFCSSTYHIALLLHVLYSEACWSLSEEQPNAT